MNVSATHAQQQCSRLATQLAGGPAILAGRPCGFSCRARCKWAQFRSTAGSGGPASHLPILCAVSGRSVGVSRVARGAPAPSKPITLGSRPYLEHAEESEVSALVYDSRIEGLRAFSWWLNFGLVAGVGLLAANQLVISLGLLSEQSVIEVLQHSLSNFWNGYAGPVADSPLKTKAALSGITFFLADLSAQSQEGRNLSSLDVKRLLRCAAVGAVLHGPLHHLYFEKLDRATIVSKYFQGGDAWFLPFIKVAVDQTVWAASWNTVFILAVSSLNGRSPSRIGSTVRGSVGRLVKSGWRLWPLVNLITYTAVPLNHRVLWIDCVELAWASVLSLHGSHEKQRGIIQARKALPAPAPSRTLVRHHSRT